MPWWAILTIVYNDAMYTVFIIMSCKTIQSTEVQGSSLTSERNVAMAPSTGTVLVRASAIYSFHIYATLHGTFQRLSCWPHVSYSALASPTSALAFQSLAMWVLFFSCLRNVSSIDSKALLCFTGLLAVMRASPFSK